MSGRSVLRRELECRQLVQRVSGYLDGDLRPRPRAAVERHLAACPDCEGYVAQVRRVVEASRSLPAPALPEGLLDVLSAQWRQVRRP